MTTRAAPLPRFDHLVAMSDVTGLFEHADHVEPRREHGYCTDDMARLLVVVAREPAPTPAVVDLGRLAFRFLADAQGVAGHVHNRRAEKGRWLDRRGVDDAWGRSVWSFGTAARAAPEPWMQSSATACFDRGMQQRSPWARAMAFAAIGAGEALTVAPGLLAARRLLADAVDVIGPLGDDECWPWPEARLTYANAVLAEARIVAGHHLERQDILDDGLRSLRWLLDRETLDGHLSPTPVGGSGPDDTGPAFDQQPIEVAAMADACRRAAEVTGDPSWLRGVELAVSWFLGDNDAGLPMLDEVTGGGFDGLHRGSVNRNEGAESTLALIATLQHARVLAPVAT